MIVYQEDKKTFLNDVRCDLIEEKIAEKVLEKLHRKTAHNEYRAWMNSMQYMYRVMENEDIPEDSEVAIEYRIPNTQKRVDFIVSGEDEEGKDTAIIIELKQWEEIEKVSSKDAIVKTYLNGNLRETTHPSYQAWAYASTIWDYNENVRKYRMQLQPCAYLHNYRLKQNDDLLDVTYSAYIKKAPVFVRGDANKLSAFISKYVKKGKPDVLYHMEHGKILPSKSLQDSVYAMLQGKPEFILLDDQKVVFEKALQIVKQQTDKKQVYIIHGGPGTGKTVLAINLLASILGLSKNVMYATKNSAPREVYKKKLLEGTYTRVSIDNLFKGSGSFTSSLENDFDCLIVDEAHRLNEKSGMFQNYGENQVKEMIHAAKTTIFFVDDYQIVTTRDIGSTQEIKKWCAYYHVDVFEDTLSSQFRCNGSDSYLNWLDSVLEITDEPVTFEGDFDIRILDTPQEVYNRIQEKNQINNKARMVAGYCWNWLKDGKNDTSVHDIKIGDFEMSWNLGSTSTWAIDCDSVNEIGCIHTCQGLEFDYIGVIVGEDMRYENGIVTDFTKRASTDQSIKGLKGMYKKHPEEALLLADKIIKNTYRTLFTRGQKGCYVYCVDKKLSEYLKKCLKSDR